MLLKHGHCSCIPHKILTNFSVTPEASHPVSQRTAFCSGELGSTPSPATDLLCDQQRTESSASSSRCLQLCLLALHSPPAAEAVCNYFHTAPKNHEFKYFHLTSLIQSMKPSKDTAGRSSVQHGVQCQTFLLC